MPFPPPLAYPLLALLLVGLPARAAEDCLAGAVEARADAAPDARSLALSVGRVIRLVGIESFALLVEDGDAAEAAMQRRLTGLIGSTLRVRALSEAPDRYGRLPALAATAEGVLVQEVLAREGVALAFATGAPLPCFERLLAAEAEARAGHSGFWSGAQVTAVEPEALSGRIGRFAIVEGQVISVGNRASRTYLNFGRRWNSDVTVEIAARDRAAFGGETGLAALAGQRVRVRGFVAAKGGPMLAVSSPMQVERLPAGAAEGEMP
jgi:hypothetical protein